MKISQIISENEKEFEEKYYNKNVPSGLNQNFRHQKAMIDDIKSFLLFSQTTLIKELIEEVKRIKSRYRCIACNGANCKHTLGCQALQKVIDCLKEEIKK